MNTPQPISELIPRLPAEAACPGDLNAEAGADCVDEDFPVWRSSAAEPAVRYWTIKLGDNGRFRRCHVAWPEPRDAMLTLGVALRGDAQIVPEMPWARILDVFDDSGERVDRVAWLPGAPGTWSLERGAATVLGADELLVAQELSRPLWLCSTPAAWLDPAARDHYWPAACLLQWGMPDLWLSGVREIVADSPELAAVLEHYLVRAPRPRFRVRPATLQKVAA
ncbi:MAG: hypothetical protein ACLQME_12535 [Alphaproteobacteria bacterium]